MSDLIERAETRRKIIEWACAGCNGNYDRDKCDLICSGASAIKVIDSIPTAEPKVGEWVYQECEYLADETDEGQIFMTGKRWYCSRCGFDKGFRMYRPDEKRCPHCGAKMERSE